MNKAAPQERQMIIVVQVNTKLHKATVVKAALQKFLWEIVPPQLCSPFLRQNGYSFSSHWQIQFKEIHFHNENSFENRFIKVFNIASKNI